jgi:hypothetical protein
MERPQPKNTFETQRGGPQPKPHHEDTENSKSRPRITRMSELTRINSGMKAFESCFKQIVVSREDFER